MYWIVDLIKRKYYETRFGANSMSAIELDVAIRSSDGKRAIAALEAGATMDTCTLGPDGYYTPVELARQLGDEDVIHLLEAYRAHHSTTKCKHASTDKT